MCSFLKVVSIPATAAAGARWMMACIMGNCVVALVSFVLYTFMLPPPLNTEALPIHTTPQPATADLNCRDQAVAGTPACRADQISARPCPRAKPTGPASKAHHPGKDADRPSPFELQSAGNGSKAQDDAAAADHNQLPAAAAGSNHKAAVRQAEGDVEEEPGFLPSGWGWLKGRPSWLRAAVLEEEHVK
jgi:hypothetical protein